MIRKRTQAARLIQHLKRREHTMGELLMYRVSNCPWKRVVEGLPEGWRIIKGKRDGLTTWRVEKV